MDKSLGLSSHSSKMVGVRVTQSQSRPWGAILWPVDSPPRPNPNGNINFPFSLEWALLLELGEVSEGWKLEEEILKEILKRFCF